MGMVDVNALAIEANASLLTSVTEEAACVLWSDDGAALMNADSYVMQCELAILGPTTCRFHSWAMDGKAIGFAALIP
ncbi:hypothetical protein [Marinobacter sp. NFXS9]|uniref:hypothetical protein n=1 Tax=Marinobacter sp. NFXS9 TaxID=2818433 RepID=UPI0032E01C8D